ncbi:MAG TPA: phospholipid carrier-dependent glycosyltransferase [Candidatus Dormibacteraeota bacterium]|nr:phospholipid carrier-dependent glycosyltransferase [Candidatus Dormibacteraeota bacterium]
MALLARPRAPYALLAVVSLLSVGARAWWLDHPSRALIFDEAYYVNAARVILGVHVPGGDHYAGSTPGLDPNQEHPPLGKLLIALGMRLFGDGALGWRILPLVFGSLAILAMFWLVRAAGGGAWLALGAAGLMAADNLSLIHGRIATLDVFVVVFMLAAVALYLRERSVLAGLALGLGCCVKLVAPYALLALALLEVGRVVLGSRAPDLSLRRRAIERLAPLATCAAVTMLAYLGILYGLDHFWSAYHNPLVHTRAMFDYAAKLTNPHGPEGIASYPWQWLLNQEPINYYTVNTNVLTDGKVTATHPVVAFQGVMNPAIILLTLPALFLAVHTARRDRDDLSLLALAWFLGTFLPFVIAAAPLGSFGNRISYLYYMVIVLPAVYLAVARLLSHGALPRAVIAGYVCILGYWFEALYPFRTWSGG